MDTIEAIRVRHSVRQYSDRPIPEDVRAELERIISERNQEDGISHVQIFYGDPACFDSFIAHYGKFDGVQNYIAMVANKQEGAMERLGYIGEELVLTAQKMGLQGQVGAESEALCRDRHRIWNDTGKGQQEQGL